MTAETMRVPPEAPTTIRVRLVALSISTDGDMELSGFLPAPILLAAPETTP